MCTPKYHPGQIFYLFYAEVHPNPDYGLPGNPERSGCTPSSIWTPVGAVMKCVVKYLVSQILLRIFVATTIITTGGDDSTQEDGNVER